MSVYAELIRVGFSVDGGCAYVTFSLDGGEEETLCFLFEVYAVSVRGKKLFSKEEYDELGELAEYSRAVIFGLRSLACSSSTRGEMTAKLRAKGFPLAARERAVNYFCEHGYIKENEIMLNEIKSCLRKKYGPVRIKRRLITRGFSSANIEKGMRKLSGYDFSAQCRELARKKAEGLLLDASGKGKLYAYLQRLGYASDTVKNAICSIEDELEG